MKPFVGVERDGPGDAGFIAPIHGNPQGLVISCGIAPRYSDIDAGVMVAASIDEAVRNAVCVGVDIDKMAGLDNFVGQIQSNLKRHPMESSNSLNSFVRIENLSGSAGLADFLVFPEKIQ